MLNHIVYGEKNKQIWEDIVCLFFEIKGLVLCFPSGLMAPHTSLLLVLSWKLDVKRRDFLN